MVAAVHDWIRLEGRAPTTDDWRPLRHGGSLRREEEFGDWPPAGVRRIVFGGWGRLLDRMRFASLWRGPLVRLGRRKRAGRA